MKKSAVVLLAKKDIGVTSCLNSTRTFYNTVRNINSDFTGKDKFPQKCRYSFESWWTGTRRNGLKNSFLQGNRDLDH